jgi:hypothetical protein
MDRDRDYGRRDLAERAGDEIRSWFGDDEAERRRRMDEMRYRDEPPTGPLRRDRWERDPLGRQGPYERERGVHAWMSRNVALRSTPRTHRARGAG